MLKTVSPFQNVIGALVYKGTWNAATNNPFLQSGIGNKGDYYYVSVAGTTNLDGITDWQIGDLAVFNGTTWQKIDNTDAVQSVNGQTGIVVLGASDVGATPNTAYVLTSGLLTGGGRLTGNVTVTLNNVPVANVPGAVPNTVNVLTSGLLTGGGPLTGNVTLGLTSVPVANVPGAVPNTVNVLAGTGLTGGGPLSANVTGLGTMATQNANSVAITGGSIGNATLSNATISSVASTFPNSYLANSTTTLGNATLTLGSTTSTVGNLTLNNATVNSGNVTASVALTNTTNANATFATSSLLLVPEGYVIVSIGGVNKKIPYYGV